MDLRKNIITKNYKTWLNLNRVRPVKRVNSGEEVKKYQERIKSTDLDYRRKIFSLPLIQINQSIISVFSPEEMEKISQGRIVVNENRYGPGSINDLRFGSTREDTRCETCYQIDCPGHYGLIKFEKSIYNPLFIHYVVLVLISVCNSCGSLLLPKEKIKNDPEIRKLTGLNRLKTIAKESKGRDCIVTRDEKYKPCERNPQYTKSKTILQNRGVIEAKKHNGKNVIHYTVPIDEVEKILSMISQEDAILLGFEPYSHPKNLIMKGLLVSPNISRPPVYIKEEEQQNEITNKYLAIISEVKKLQTQSPDTEKVYRLLKEFFIGESSEERVLDEEEVATISRKIQEKKGLIRHKMMGKRNNFCARTVAGPGSDISFGEIRVPEVVAEKLTKAIRINSLNKSYIEELIEQGKIETIIEKDVEIRKKIRKGSYVPKIGDIAEVKLQDGDWISNNRQPTLHRSSLMAYKVKLSKEKTIGVHLSNTTPMNCDFDGDENNLWLPRNYETDVECKYLLNTKRNIMSNEKNMPMMALVFNSITGSFLMTKFEKILDAEIFFSLLDLISERKEKESLRERASRYNLNYFSSRVLYSALFPEDFFYENEKEDNKVRIVEGILVSGYFSKEHIGISHRSIVQELHKLYGYERTALFISEGTKLINAYLTHYGFTVGLLDVMNLKKDEETGKEIDASEEILKLKLSEVYNKVESLGGKYSNPIEEEERKRKINESLDIIRNLGIKLAQEVLVEDNSLTIMTERGAKTKGQIENIAQIVGSVGQQYFQGERIPAKLSNGRRVLPSFDLDDNDPRSHGFVPESFFKGLSPEGLFFIQAGGREGIINTHLTTADTGTLQRSLTKAFENFIIYYDGSVRNINGVMFMPNYNMYFDPAELLKLEGDKTGFIDLKSLALNLNGKRGWIKSNNEIGNKKETSSDIVENKDITIKKKKLNIFEESRLIAARAGQIENGSEVFINKEEINSYLALNPIEIAEMEYERGLLDNYIYILRKYPDGYTEKIYPGYEEV